MTLVLPPSLEGRRPEFERTLAAAHQRLRRFAAARGWERHMDEPFAREARIHDTKAAFDRDFLDLAGADPATRLPATYCAALERSVLVSVSPEIYREVYPEGAEEAAFEKLLAHEMAHRLHIRILGGDEDAMGPVWFFEGFAIVAAGQFEGAEIDDAALREVVASRERGSYRLYAAAMWRFLRAVALEEMVERARGEGLVEWLKVAMKHPCPACGFLVFEEPAGSFDICPLCDWEDDAVQLRHPDLRGGANRESLREHQAEALRAFPAGITEHRGYRRERDWRPLRPGERAEGTRPV